MTGLVVAGLVVGFFAGPLKFLVGGWWSYIVPDGLVLAIALRGWTRRPVDGAPLFLPFLLFAAYCVLELLNPDAPPIRSMMGLRSFLLYTALYFAGYGALRSRTEIVSLFRALVALGLVTGAFGVWQWYLGASAVAGWGGWYEEFSETMQWDRATGEVVFRPFSTFVQPGTFGSNMAAVMVLTLAGVIARDMPGRWRAALVIAFFVMGSGLLVSGSRTAMVELFGGASIVLWLRRDVRLWAKGGVLLVVALWAMVSLVGTVLIERFSTILESDVYIDRWLGAVTAGLDIARENPIGRGLGYTGGVPFFVATGWLGDLPTRNLDSGIGAIAAELGFLGLALYLVLLGGLAWTSLKAWRSLPDGIPKDLMAAPAAFAVLSLVMTPLLNPVRATLPWSIYFWLLTGALAGAAAAARESATGTALPRTGRWDSPAVPIQASPPREHLAHRLPGPTRDP